MSSEKEIKISIIIVAYIKQDIIEDCLESIYKFNDIGNKLEVIVVDNSPDNSKLNQDLILKFPFVKLIKNDNRGFGQGNNVGVQHSRGKYLFFLNPDTKLIEPILAYAYKKLEKNREIGMLGFQLVDNQNNKNHSFYFLREPGIIGTLTIKALNSLGIYLDGLMFLSGANMFMPRDIFYKIGMFDENFFMYGEERDLTHRIHAISKKTYFCRDKRIFHLEGGTTDDDNIALRRRVDSIKYYCEKYKIDFNSYLEREIRTNKIKLKISKILNKYNSSKFINTIKVMEEYL